MSAPAASVVVPALNEGANLIATVAEFSARGVGEPPRIMGVSELRVAGKGDEVAALAAGRIR